MSPKFLYLGTICLLLLAGEYLRHASADLLFVYCLLLLLGGGVEEFFFFEREIGLCARDFVFVNVMQSFFVEV